MSIIQNFEAENYTNLMAQISEFAKEQGLQIVDFSTIEGEKYEALVLYSK